MRFASGDEELRSEFYDQLGDALFENLASVQTHLEALLNECSAPSESSDPSDSSDDVSARKGPPERTKKKLLDPRTWERDGKLVETANALLHPFPPPQNTPHSKATSCS